MPSGKAITFLVKTACILCADISSDPLFRFTALGWDVVTIDGNDMHAVASALDAAKANKNGKPSLIIAKTVIGKVPIIPAYPSILLYIYIWFP